MSETDNGGPVSKKKREANRRNAQLSTGPKTEAGKNHSRRNAVKHGVLASALLVTKGGGAEDAAEFEELLSDLNRDLAPVGRLEEMMVEKIAVCSWRQKRALRYEALLIRQASGEHSPELYEALEFSMTLIRDRLRSRERWALAQEIFQRAGISQPETATELEAVPQPQTASPPEEGIADDPRDLLLEELLSTRDFAADSDLKKVIYHFGLPAEADLNRILRYETSIQRQLAHAINQLERLQRARQREHLLTPLSEVLSNGDILV